MSSVSPRRAQPVRARSERRDLAPIVSFAGLLVAAVVSFGLLNGQVPLPGGGGGGGGGGITGPRRTPNPSVIFTPAPPDRVEIRGTILFVQRGSIWSATGTDVRRISTRAVDAMPAWSPNGETIYYIETREREARVPVPETGRDGTYILRYPAVMAVTPDGQDRREIHDGLLPLGGGPNRAYFNWLRQPDVSPDGETLALISDAPEPFAQDLTLSLLPAAGGDVERLSLPHVAPLGHADPDWSPDGRLIAYTLHDREGSSGAPRIALYDVAESAAEPLSASGFARPSWSPDGQYLAVEETDGSGRDIVVIRADDGTLVTRITRDGAGIAPSWSPDGRQIAYLKVDGQHVDLHVLTLSDDGRFSVEEDDAITSDSGLDANSRPAWFMPPDLIPTPAPSSRDAGSPSPEP
jgi:Tol biopolymer transport system component